MQKVMDEKIINDSIGQFTIEYVTMEASENFYTNTAVIFNFPQSGLVKPSHDIYTF